jgi:integrase
MLERAKLPKRRIHDLRHTCVSLLAAEGVPLKTIAEIVGHSDIRLTQNIYQHVFSQEKKDAAKKMDRIFKS